MNQAMQGGAASPQDVQSQTRGGPMRKTKWEKLLGGDGVEIVIFTISAWVLLFVVYILGFVFRLW
jgi:hypothetical protein